MVTSMTESRWHWIGFNTQSKLLYLYLRYDFLLVTYTDKRGYLPEINVLENQCMLWIKKNDI
jgi:hypothetical protein